MSYVTQQEKARHSEATLTKVRQLTDSVNDTFWHDNTAGAPVTRPLTAYGHRRTSEQLV